MLYNLVTKEKLEPINEEEKLHKRHRFHKYTMTVPVLVFLLLAIFTKLNHIYCGVAGMFAGAIAALWCRPDLKLKIWIGGILFTLLYFIYFTSLRLVYPSYIEHVWNFEEITEILVVGIPLEEYLFAFTFGMFWSSIYEHTHWFKLVKTT